MAVALVAALAPWVLLLGALAGPARLAVGSLGSWKVGMSGRRTVHRLQSPLAFQLAENESAEKIGVFGLSL